MVIRSSGYKDIVYADDMNAFKEYPSCMADVVILRGMKNIQKELHLWGEANGVRFDAGKTSFHILSRSTTYGGNFKLLGINFDPKLLMNDDVHDCVRMRMSPVEYESGPLRARRYPFKNGWIVHHLYNTSTNSPVRSGTRLGRHFDMYYTRSIQ